MSTVKVRELPAIQAEFQQACAKAGHLQYQIEVFKRDLEGLNDRLLELNKEAHARSLLDSKDSKGKSKKSPPVEINLPASDSVSQESEASDEQ